MSHALRGAPFQTAALFSGDGGAATAMGTQAPALATRIKRASRSLCDQLSLSISLNLRSAHEEIGIWQISWPDW